MKTLLMDRRETHGSAQAATQAPGPDRRELEKMIDRGVSDLDQARRLIKALAWALIQLKG